MGKVYLVNGIHGGTEYVNTSREADSRFRGDGAESVDGPLDAAGECNKFVDEVRDAERTINSLRLMLIELVDVCPDDVLVKTGAGRRAAKFVAENPLPPATDAHRDGERSYGGG